MFLEVDDVAVSFDGHAALDGVTLGIDHREVVTVLGPSGGGKSTLLRVVAGLQDVDRGRVRLDGIDITGVPTHRRGIGFMFQDYSLFPHRNVAGNVGFGLRMQGWGSDRIAARVREVLALVGLPGFAERTIDDLSGGEQQRVALARALAPSPEVLLLDEPLGALDRALREHLIGELAVIFAELELTVLLVTHDRDEAFDLGHRVAVMDRGRISQVASPEEIWQQPVDGFVARFLGHTGLIPAWLVDGEVHTEWGPSSIRAPVGPDGPIELLVRPDRAGLVEDGPGRPPPGGLAIPGLVHRVVPRGPMALHTIQVGPGTIEVWHSETLVNGSAVTIVVPPDGLLALPAG